MLQLSSASHFLRAWKGHDTRLKRCLVGGKKKGNLLSFSCKKLQLCSAFCRYQGLSTPSLPNPPAHLLLASHRCLPPLTCSLILPFTRGLKSSYHQRASLRHHSCSTSDKARVDPGNPSHFIQKDNLSNKHPEGVYVSRGFVVVDVNFIVIIEGTVFGFVFFFNRAGPRWTHMAAPEGWAA